MRLRALYAYTPAHTADVFFSLKYALASSFQVIYQLICLLVVVTLYCTVLYRVKYNIRLYSVDVVQSDVMVSGG